MTKEARADLIDKALHVLMVRGRKRRSFGSARGGPVCGVGALNVAAGGNPDGTQIKDSLLREAAIEARGDLGRAARRAGWPSFMDYNDDQRTTDDEIFELMRNTAKELRDG